MNAQVFRAVLEEQLVDVRYKTYEAPFNSDTFFWTDFTPRAGLRHARTSIARYLGRLRDVPRYFDEQIANMRAGLARGFTVPRVSVIGRDRTIEPYVKGGRDQPAVRAVRADAAGDPGGRAGSDARRSAHA